MANSLKPIVLGKVTFSVAKFVAAENFRSEFNLTLNQLIRRTGG